MKKWRVTFFRGLVFEKIGFENSFCNYCAFPVEIQFVEERVSTIVFGNHFCATLTSYWIRENTQKNFYQEYFIISITALLKFSSLLSKKNFQIRFSRKLIPKREDKYVRINIVSFSHCYLNR